MNLKFVGRILVIPIIAYPAYDPFHVVRPTAIMWKWQLKSSITRLAVYRTEILHSTIKPVAVTPPGWMIMTHKFRRKLFGLGIIDAHTPINTDAINGRRTTHNAVWPRLLTSNANAGKTARKKMKKGRFMIISLRICSLVGGRFTQISCACLRDLSLSLSQP